MLSQGPEEAQFVDLTGRGFNRIPVWYRLSAGLDSPLSLYHRLRGRDSVLLESAATDFDNGRYSIICPPARYRLEVRGNRVLVLDGGQISERGHEQDPIAWLEDFMARFRIATEAMPEGMRSWGGLYGYFGYDTVRLIEPRLKDGRKDKPGALTDIPDICQLLCDEVVVLDHHRGQVLLLVYADPEEMSWHDAQNRLLHLKNLACDETRDPPLFVPDAERAEEGVGMQYQFDSEAYEAAVERIRAYTRAGDCMQVVLGGVMQAPMEESPLLLYRSLRAVSPSPYMYFLDFGDFQIAGASPEELVRLDGRRILLRPIAGTRRRGRTAREDRELEQEMLADPKEIAEHLMLVDLGRNDVGRVAQTGSVVVHEYLAVRRYSQVMHLVSTLTGVLPEDMTAFDLLRATFPAGTLSGAPKVRAMEIIDELEPVGRGLYGGGVGCINHDGNMSLAIAIRTAVIQNGQMFIGAGGGVVADSVPHLEWREAHNKARLFERALARMRQE